LCYYFNTSLRDVGRVKIDQVFSCLALIPDLEFRKNAQVAHLSTMVSQALGGKKTFEEVLMPFAKTNSQETSNPYILTGQELADFRLGLRLGLISQWVLNRMMKGPGD
jgi:uncharacterized membrane protein YjdF